MPEQTFESAAALPPVVKTDRMRAIEDAHHGQDVRVVILRLYNELGSQRAVARALGVAQPTLSDWLRVLGIQTAAWPEAWLEKARP